MRVINAIKCSYYKFKLSQVTVWHYMSIATSTTLQVITYYITILNIIKFYIILHVDIGGYYMFLHVAISYDMYSLFTCCYILPHIILFIFLFILFSA